MSVGESHDAAKTIKKELADMSDEEKEEDSMGFTRELETCVYAEPDKNGN